MENYEPATRADVTLSGWVHRRRDHGGVAFFDLRDRTGLVQVTINPDLPKELLDHVTNVRMEWVLQIEGIVQIRPDGMKNPKMETGEIEIIARKCNNSQSCKDSALHGQRGQ